MEFRDISSVQILRGPQGTLFDADTIGGAVSLTTNQPGEEAGNSVRLGVGGAICSKPSARRHPARRYLGGARGAGGRQRDGYVERAFDGEDLGDEEM